MLTLQSSSNAKIALVRAVVKIPGGSNTADIGIKASKFKGTYEFDDVNLKGADIGQSVDIQGRLADTQTRVSEGNENRSYTVFMLVPPLKDQPERKPWQCVNGEKVIRVVTEYTTLYYALDFSDSASGKRLAMFNRVDNNERVLSTTDLTTCQPHYLSSWHNCSESELRDTGAVVIR